MALMGFTYGPWELSCRNCFLPTFVIRELSFNMAGIIGSFCTYDCDLAGDPYSLTWFYLSAACISLFSLLVIKREHVSVINNGLSLQTKMTSIFFSI
jgi:hypothetical protein